MPNMKMHPIWVRSCAQRVQEGVLKGKHTHIGCVLVDDMCRMATSRKTHPEVRFSVRHLRISVLIS